MLPNTVDMRDMSPGFSGGKVAAIQASPSKLSGIGSDAVIMLCLLGCFGDKVLSLSRMCGTGSGGLLKSCVCFSRGSADSVKMRRQLWRCDEQLEEDEDAT